jgi:hypothetical protein
VRALTRVLACVVALVACGTPEPGGDGIDVDRALATVNELAAIGPRVRDTAAAKRAAAWIEAQLTSSGIPVEKYEVGVIDLPELGVMGRIVRSAHQITVTDPNLVVRFGSGSGKALLVIAHYDSVPDSPGAIDNAASVGVLLELARVLHKSPPPQPVILAFTAAEEVGLVGGEALAAELADRVSFAIALDLIGGDGELVVNGASTLIGTSELRWLADAADRAGVELGFPYVHRAVSRAWPQAERSDHGPFTRRGTRAVHFYHRGHDGEWIDRAYHTGRDVPARVQRGAIDDVGRLLLGLAMSPVPAHTGDGFVVPFVRGVIVPRWSAVALCVVLVLVVVGSLLTSRAGLFAYLARSRDDTRGAGLLAGVACYVIAVGVAFAIERLTSDAPGRWLHDPLRALAGTACVIAGAFGLATRAVSRFAPWRGESRYLAIAALVPLAIGVMWLVLGVVELAWVWLVPAAAIAVAPMLPRVLAIVAVALSALPLVLVLYPHRLREAAWNGFLPSSFPLAAAVGGFGIAVAASFAWALRRRNAAGPMGTLALGVGCGLLVCVGFVVAITAPTPCSRAEFVMFQLGCERV